MDQGGIEMIRGEQLVQWMEEWAPKHLAMPEDRIGLQVGRIDRPIRRIMVTLDLLENVADEAVEKGVDLIISHHPLIYHPLKQIRTDLSQGRIVSKLLKNDIAVYVCHTNFDAAEGGMNDLMADRLGLIDPEVLSPSYTEELRKIVVFVPQNYVEQVFQALTEAGAGWIGKYSHCTFQAEGIGTFLPRAGSHPFIGEEGRVEKVSEIRMESIIRKDSLKKVISAMLKAHPYEEVAYDVYPVEQTGKVYGVGRIGRLDPPLSLRELAIKVKERFSLQGVRMVGDTNRLVKKVAVLGGSGRDFIAEAANRGADVYITGDIGYHDAHEAMSRNLALIDGGHIMEKIMKEGVTQFLMKKIREVDLETEIFPSEARTDPFNFL